MTTETPEADTARHTALCKMNAREHLAQAQFCMGVTASNILLLPDTKAAQEFYRRASELHDAIQQLDRDLRATQF